MHVIVTNSRAYVAMTITIVQKVCSALVAPKFSHLMSSGTTALLILRSLPRNWFASFCFVNLFNILLKMDVLMLSSLSALPAPSIDLNVTKAATGVLD